MKSLKISNAIIRYADLTEIGKFGKYSVTLVLDQADPQIQSIKSLIEDEAKEVWGTKWKETLGSAINGGATRYALQNGDTTGKPEYEGKIVVKAASRGPVPLYDAAGLPTKDPVLFHNGDLINLIVAANCYSPSYPSPDGKSQISHNQALLVILGARFVSHGTPFIGGAPSLTPEDLAALGIESDSLL